jgi:hypothetical protein
MGLRMKNVSSFSRGLTPKPFAITTEGRETNNNKHDFMFAKFDDIIRRSKPLLFGKGDCFRHISFSSAKS